jgi:V8-like Glu-specific endopeptidase
MTLRTSARALSLALLLAAFYLVPGAGYGAVAERDKVIVSDGRQIALVAGSRSYWPSSTGTVELGVTAAERASSGIGRDSAGAFSHLSALQAVQAPVGIESVIGQDNRSRVSPTTAFPARTTVLVTFSAGRCTGWLISKDTVIPAG